MLWARVMRGISSIESAVTPRAASARAMAGSPSGSRKAMSVCPGRVRARSASPAGVPGGEIRTRRRRSARDTTSAAVASDFRALVGKRVIGQTGGVAGAALQEDGNAGLGERGQHGGGQRHAAFARQGLGEDSSDHDAPFYMGGPSRLPVGDKWRNSSAGVPPSRGTFMSAVEQRQEQTPRRHRSTGRGAGASALPPHGDDLVGLVTCTSSPSRSTPPPRRSA